MPNVIEMEKRLQSHLARVSDKAVTKEMRRIDRLQAEGKISRVTGLHMFRSMQLRLACIANAG